MTSPACCHACGCNDLRRVGKRSAWGVESIEFRCGHCGEQHMATVEELAAEAKAAATPPPPRIEARWPRTRCVICGSTDCPVRSTRGKIRHHICRDCGARFKSTER